MKFDATAYVLRFNASETIPIPDAQVDRCHIYGRLLNRIGEPIVNARIDIRVTGWVDGAGNVVTTPPAFYPPSLIAVLPDHVFTDVNGNFSFESLRKLVLSVDIPDAGYTRVVKVPDAPNANFFYLETA